MSINHYIKPFNIDIESAEYTPVSLTMAINEKLTRSDAPEIIIEGLCTGFNNEPYNGYYFGKLVDPQKRDFYLKVKVSEYLIHKIVPDTICTMRGYLDKQISNRNDGSIGVVFRPAEVLGVTVCENLRKHQKECSKIISEKEKRGKINVYNVVVSAIKKGRKVNILIITGEKSVAFTDVIKSVGKPINFYNIEEKRINFRNKKIICETLQQYAKYSPYDVIAIVRGGGEGLEIFSNVDVLAAAAAIRSSALVTALGHFEDEPEIEQIADYAYGTPSAFGNFLSKAAGAVRREFIQNKQEKSNRTAWSVAAISTLAFLALLINQFIK